MSGESLKAKTVALIRWGRQLERETVAALSPAQRDIVGTLETWGTKDKMIHINAWKAVTAENFADARAGRIPDFRDDSLAFNDATFETYRDASWAEVARYCDDATSRLIAEIEAYDDEELAQHGLYEWMNGQNVAESALSTCLWHGLVHITEPYVERGDRATVLQMFNRIFPAVLEVIQGERAVATANYNQACVLAQLGATEEVLPLLEAAFEGRPDLKAYSTQDTDLTTLWDFEGFKALVSEPSPASP